MAEEFKAITTQEELDEVIKDRLKRERDKLSKEVQEKYKDYDSLRAELSKAKESSAELETLQKKLQAYEKAEMKRKVAMEYKIPYDLADRIQGDDEESMAKDAKSLQTYLTYFKKEAPPLKNTETTPKKDDAYKKLLDGLKGE